jgi:hypothetical protein
MQNRGDHAWPPIYSDPQRHRATPADARARRTALSRATAARIGW